MKRLRFGVFRFMSSQTGNPANEEIRPFSPFLSRGKPKDGDTNWYTLALVRRATLAGGLGVVCLTLGSALSADETAVRCFVLSGQAALDACSKAALDSDLSADVRAEAHYNRGVELDRSGRLDEAIASYREALRLKPDYAAAYNNIGVALGKQLRWNDAISAYREATRLHPAYANAHYDLGVALVNAGRWTEALSAFREAAQLEPRDADAQYNIGRTLNHLGRHREAALFYREAVRLRSDYVQAWSNLGLTANLIGDYKESVAAFERAESLRPGYFDTRPIQREAWKASLRGRRVLSGPVSPPGLR